MEITRRTFLKMTGLSVLAILFGRFTDLFRKSGSKRAMYWREGSTLVG